MEELQLLSGKLDQLLKKYTALQSENAKLKAVIAEKETKAAQMDKKVAELEQNIVAVQIGKTMMNEEEKNKMRKQLDNVISEIDKIMAALND